MSDFILNQDMANSLGWSFIHSLWIGLLIAIILQVGMRLIDSAKSQKRYWFSVSMLALFVIANGITYTIIISTGLPVINLEIGQEVLSIESPMTISVNSTVQAMGDYYLMYFMQVWIIGAIFFFVKFIVDVYKVNRLKTYQTTPVAESWLSFLDNCLDNIGINKTIIWLESPHVSTPQVVGYFKPVILFPLGMLSGLTFSQVEAILMHELSHIRRHDYLVNIFQSLIDVIYYFNPFVWYISHRIRIEREHACDDETIASGVSAQVYANTLAKMYAFQFEGTNLAMPIASNNKLTLRRIKRIMQTQMNNNKSRSIFGVLLAPLLFLCLVAVQWYPANQEMAPAVMNIPDIQQTEEVKGFQEPVSPSPSLVQSVAEVVAVERVSDEPSNINQSVIASINSIPSPIYVDALDTIDIDAINNFENQMEEAMEALETSDEWAKMQELSIEMTEMSLQMKEAMEPIMSKQFKMAVEQMHVNEEQMKQLSQMASESFDVDEMKKLAEELKQSMAIEEAEMQKHIAEMKISLEEMDLDLVKEQAELAKELAKVAQLNALEIKELTVEAQRIAKEAEVYSEEIKEYHNKLADMLVKDGYVKSKDDIEDLVIKNGEIEVNGKKVKKQDLKKYQDLQKAYFKGEDFNFSQHK